MDLTEQQKRELKQHYFWMGLTFQYMKPWLTDKEHDLLAQFSTMFATRMNITVSTLGGEWPNDHDERWEALK